MANNESIARSVNRSFALTFGDAHEEYPLDQVAWGSENLERSYRSGAQCFRTLANGDLRDALRHAAQVLADRVRTDVVMGCVALVHDDRTPEILALTTFAKFASI